jgi:hypothetical protein
LSEQLKAEPVEEPRDDELIILAGNFCEDGEDVAMLADEIEHVVTERTASLTAALSAAQAESERVKAERDEARAKLAHAEADAEQAIAYVEAERDAAGRRNAELVDAIFDGGNWNALWKAAKLTDAEVEAAQNRNEPGPSKLRAAAAEENATPRASGEEAE